jgi:hypothetical protein
MRKAVTTMYNRLAVIAHSAVHKYLGTTAVILGVSSRHIAQIFIDTFFASNSHPSFISSNSDPDPYTGTISARAPRVLFAITDLQLSPWLFDVG